MRDFLRTTLIGIGITGLMWGQAAASKAPAKAPAKPAQAKPVPAKPAAAPSQVTTIIQLVKSGLSESLILQTIKQEGKAYQLTTAELLALQQAGASENIIAALMNPAAAQPQPAAAASTAATPSTPAAVVEPAASAPASAPATVAAAPQKRRIAVEAFDYSAVRTWVTFWFNSDVNIGQGIRSMMVVRMAKSNKVTLLEREKLQGLMREQDLGASNRFAQGTKARIGRLKGADAILYGDIVIFGRDDAKKGSALGGVSRSLGGVFGRVANATKEDKAVVGINYRIVDAETGEVLDTGEARGESSRRSTNWGAIVGKGGNAAAGGYDMTSSNFQETIIGEATSNAVDGLIAQLDQKVANIGPKQMDIEGRVASISGSTVYLNVGANDGVQSGDRFEIHQIISEIVDPDTKEVLDKQTARVGELVVSSVRERVSSGQYSGQALSPTSPKGYAARKIN